MSFHEVRLPSDVDRGAQGGPMFSTTVIVVASGAEQRVVQWSRPRMRWSIGHSLKTVAQMGVLLQFFVSRQGRAYGWRLKDWFDFDSTLGGVETKHNTLLLTSTTFQIQKIYSSGGVSLARKIVKPSGDTLTNTAATQANSTVRVWNASSVEVTSGWTVDLTTGIITFSGAPGYLPKATFQYDVPVRFDTDAMKTSLDEVTFSSWPGVDVVELLL